MPKKERIPSDFTFFWLGQSLSLFGTQITAVALPLVAAVTLHSGAGGVSIIATATFLPNLALPLLVGNWLERRRRRLIMIGTDLLRALGLAVVPVAGAFDRLSVALLVAVALWVGSLSVVFDVASFAYIPSLVPERFLPRANRAMQASTTTAQIGGPGVAGLLAQLLSPAVALAFDAVSYLASAVGIGSARTPEPPPELPDRPGGVFSGIGLLFRNRYLRALTISAAAYNAAFLVITVNLLIYVVNVRGAGPGLYGLALSAGGAGSLLGALVALPLIERLGFGRALAASVLFSSTVPLLYAVFPLRGAALAAAVGACQFVAGIGGGSANVLSTTLRQQAIPASALARTIGSYRFFIFGTIPIGTVLGGVLGSSLGSRWGVGLGAIGLVLSMAPLLRPTIRSLPTAAAAAENTKANDTKADDAKADDSKADDTKGRTDAGLR